MSGLPAYLRLVRAGNAGPMTLDGTNTWILGDPELGPPLVVDPGPADETHLEAVRQAAGGRLSCILLTHRHADHAAGAPALAGRAGCGVRAADPRLRLGEEGLADGSRIEAAGVVVNVHATPGHTSDSCSLLLRGPDGAVWVLTGDTVLGRGTSVITHPDGDLGAYLDSLDRLQQLVAKHQVQALLPGHGPLVLDPAERLEQYREHRRLRLAEVRQALAGGARTPAEVVEVVYRDVDPAVRPAAEQSVRSQLEYLASLSEAS